MLIIFPILLFIEGKILANVITTKARPMHEIIHRLDSVNNIVRTWTKGKTGSKPTLGQAQKPSSLSPCEAHRNFINIQNEVHGSFRKDHIINKPNDNYGRDQQNSPNNQQTK